ncbi:hypothetical protein KC963_00440 [Candidatus Saccharibacteria bacterium]|nr:hypothetical protein [Candidatus Saccharibacteria bacterium]
MRKQCGNCTGERQYSCDTLFDINAQSLSVAAQAAEEGMEQGGSAAGALDFGTSAYTFLAANLVDDMSAIGCELTPLEIQERLQQEIGQE